MKPIRRVRLPEICCETNLPFHIVTNGQRVPEDLADSQRRRNGQVLFLPSGACNMTACGTRSADYRDASADQAHRPSSGDATAQQRRNARSDQCRRHSGLLDAVDKFEPERKRQIQDLRRSSHSRRHPRQSSRSGLGAAIASQEKQGSRTDLCRTQTEARPSGDRRRSVRSYGRKPRRLSRAHRSAAWPDHRFIRKSQRQRRQ